MPTKFEEGIVYRVRFRKASNVEYELIGRFVSDNDGDLFFACDSKGGATKVTRDRIVWTDEMPSSFELKGPEKKK